MIQIDLCRVSSDGQFIDIIAECTAGHHFTNITIEQLHGETWKVSSKTMQEHFNNSKIVMRVPTAYISEDGYRFYHLIFEENTVEGEECIGKTVAEAACSDISGVYRYLLDSLMGLCCERCEVEIPEEVRRMFSLLYAHNEAIKQGDYQHAAYFYEVLYKKFNRCPQDECAKSNYNNRTGVANRGCGCKK